MLRLIVNVFLSTSILAGIPQVQAESLEPVLQRNVAFLRASAGCSVPIDFDRAFFQHLKYTLTQRNVLIAHLEVNFDYYTINKRYHLLIMPDSRGVSMFAQRQKFRRSSLIPSSYSYEHIATAVSRPVTDICRTGFDRDQAVQEAIFTSLVDAAISGMLPYESLVGATVCFTRNVNPDHRTKTDEILNLPNARFHCCQTGEYLETCGRNNRTIDDVVDLQVYSIFLYVLYAIVYGYLLPLVIAWVLCDVNCLEDGRTLSYVVNPKTVYFGYAQLGFPPIIKKATFVLLGISGYALISIIALTDQSPSQQLAFIVCFLFLSVVLMFSAKRLVQAEALRPADRYMLGFLQIYGDLPQQKTVLSSSLGPKTDLLLQQQHDTLIIDHPDITVYPSISDCSRLLFMSKYWSRYCKVLRRLCSEYRGCWAAMPLLAPALLLGFVLNTIPLVQLTVFVLAQIRALVQLHANGASTMVLFICSTILFIGYVALLLYIPCVLILCLYYTVMAMLHSIHLMIVGLAFAIIIYQLGIFICQEAEKFTYMTDCVVRLNLTYLRYEGAFHRAPCCEQLIRSMPLQPNHVQINSIFFDSLVKSFFPLSHSIKTICFRAGLFLFCCSLLFVVLLQCGAQFFVDQQISFNLLLAVLVPKLVFSLWPCCSSNSLQLPSPSVEQAIYLLIDDWYRKNCQNSPKPSATLLKIGPGVEFVSKMSPQLGTRDVIIANMMEPSQFADNYYGTINTGKYSGSPMANYGDTLAESGRYTMTSSRGVGQLGTLTTSLSNHGPQQPSTLSHSMIKHAVFATKQRPHTASTADTGSEVDSILYYNDIISKHPSERHPASYNPMSHRTYCSNNGKQSLMDTSMLSSNAKSPNDITDSSSNGDSESPVAGSPSSFEQTSSSNNQHLRVPSKALPVNLGTLRSQSETDESSL